MDEDIIDIFNQPSFDLVKSFYNEYSNLENRNRNIFNLVFVILKSINDYEIFSKILRNLIELNRYIHEKVIYIKWSNNDTCYFYDGIFKITGNDNLKRYFKENDMFSFYDKSYIYNFHILLFFDKIGYDDRDIRKKIFMESYKMRNFFYYIKRVNLEYNNEYISMAYDDALYNCKASYVVDFYRKMCDMGIKFDKSNYSKLVENLVIDNDEYIKVSKVDLLRFMNSNVYIYNLDEIDMKKFDIYFRSFIYNKNELYGTYMSKYLMDYLYVNYKKYKYRKDELENLCVVLFNNKYEMVDFIRENNINMGNILSYLSLNVNYEKCYKEGYIKLDDLLRMPLYFDIIMKLNLSRGDYFRLLDRVGDMDMISVRYLINLIRKCYENGVYYKYNVLKKLKNNVLLVLYILLYYDANIICSRSLNKLRNFFMNNKLLCEKIINMLPDNYKRYDSKVVKGDGRECIICFSSINDNMILCENNHGGHLSCMIRWLERKSTCPYCRANI